MIPKKYYFYAKVMNINQSYSLLEALTLLIYSNMPMNCAPNPNRFDKRNIY